MIKACAFFCFALALTASDLQAQSADEAARKLSDAPEVTAPPTSQKEAPADYTSALHRWKTIAEINQWIKEHFCYEPERAKKLAENSPERETTDIYTPEEFYQLKKGVCLDLSRFAVETANRIDSSKHIQYLMIEFEPLILDGSILKKHWVAIYRESAGFYIFADSKRPGHVSGPYGSPEAFIIDYQTFRGRKIVDWKVLLSYQKKKAVKTQRQEWKRKN
ncbi:MAG: transglutaminase-like domain-containing protein [Spirosomataceae bacterium]